MYSLRILYHWKCYRTLSSEVGRSLLKRYAWYIVEWKAVSKTIGIL